MIRTILYTTLFLGASSAFAADDLEARYAAAYRAYDLEEAVAIKTELEAVQSDVTMLYTRACLLVAELYRIEFEDTPKKDIEERRRLGALIDQAANAGLAAVEGAPESSESARLEADLLATRIRTKFQAKKFRKRMEASIDRARERDPDDPLPLISAAKPLIFAGERRGGDLDEAIRLLDRALELDPENDRAYTFKGIALLESGDLAAAREAWQQALQANPACHPASARLKQTEY